jgi:ribosomal protein S18 acetylase RimI-like enzyme
MAGVEQLARRIGCCKITLEVLEGNIVAQALYRSSGFAGYKLDPKLGRAMLWQRWL